MAELLERERGRGDTVWDRLVAELRAQIERGTLPPGARLMSEGEPRQHLRHRAHPVREALKELTAWGSCTRSPAKAVTCGGAPSSWRTGRCGWCFSKHWMSPNPYVSTLLRGVQETCQKRGCTLQLFARQGEAHSRIAAARS